MLTALPTSGIAQSWRLEPRVQRELQADVDDFTTMIARQALQPTERRVLEPAIRAFKDRFVQASHDGLDSSEIAELENQVNRIRRRLGLESRRWTTSR